MYEARISRNHPAAFLILIDQSGSMSEPTTFHGRRMSKSEAVALTVNMLIDELLNRCKREEGYRDYFDIAVQGYHGDRVVSLWGDPERTFMRPSELAGAELCGVDVQQERTLPGGKTVVSVISQKIWVRPLASDKTPMYSALRRCHELCSQWCSRRSNRESYPPTIFNITDGESSEGDERRLLDAAESIRKLGTDDGTALLINIHICSDESRRQVLFPMSEQELPEQRYARLLYRMSSTMPDIYGESIVRLRGGGDGPFRGMSYNAGMTELVSMMDIGSVSVNLLF